MDSNYQVFISEPCGGSLLAVSVDTLYIYTLSYHAEVPAAHVFVKPTPSRHVVHVYYRSFSNGQYMTSYDTSCKWTYSTGQPRGELDMCVTSGYLAIIDQVHNTITVCQTNHAYSVMFNIQQRKIHFPGTYVAQCATNNNSIVLMTRVDLKEMVTARVSQVDLPTGNLIWTYVHDISCGPPLLATTCYAGGRLLIVSDQFKVMIQLDIKTGKKLCELVSTDTGTQETQSDSAGGPRMKDLVSARRLLVTVESGKVQYYQIKSV